MEAYLFFNGNCEEALEFYKRCLGGEITTLMRYEGTPMDNGQLPPGWKQKVMHSTFESEGARFMASDGMPGQPAPSYGGFAMSVFVPGDAANARKAFEALSEGGKVTMPFEPPFWGGHFGMLTDRFGIPWMVSSEH
ncbi:VOC family protein [Ramlibacter rhizophilus]|uniref:VOC family protein n=1 Tax=Ramlibacter rhizophilus TaxID=1781167 RepID=A0A4Z0BMH9_9BURK|nr:VOC family protein [Ramlibacter rhizophilus]